MSPQVLKYQLHRIDMTLTWILGVNQDAVQVDDDKDVKLLGQDFIDVALEGGKSIGETKRHNLILEVIIPGLKSRLPLIIFSDSHSMICVRQI